MKFSKGRFGQNMGEDACELSSLLPEKQLPDFSLKSHILMTFLWIWSGIPWVN